MSSLVRYVPPAREITNITNSAPAIVTTALPHGYFDGIFVTINIPYPNMMQEIAGQTYLARIVNNVSFALFDIRTFLPVDTRNSTVFNTGPTILVRPPVGAPFLDQAQIPQAVPSGEFATTLLNASNVIGPRNPNG